MGLSSNVLWHQTNKKGFFQILESQKLLYAYSLENSFSSGNSVQPETNESLAFPMISLSDFLYVKCLTTNGHMGTMQLVFLENGVIEISSLLFGIANVHQMFNLMIKTLEDAEKNDEKSEELKKRLGNYLYLFSNVKSVQGPLPKRKYVILTGDQIKEQQRMDAHRSVEE